MITSVEKMYPTPLSVFIRLGFLLSFSILDLNLPTNTSIALLSALFNNESWVLVSSIELAISSLVRATWLLARNTLRMVVSFFDKDIWNPVGDIIMSFFFFFIKSFNC